MREHRQARKIVQPAFNKNSLIAFNHRANHHVKILLKKLATFQNKAVDLQKLTHLLFLDLTCDTSLGQDLQAQNTIKEGDVHGLVKNLELWEKYGNEVAQFVRGKIPFVLLYDSMFKNLDYYLHKFAPEIATKRDNALNFIRNYVKTVTDAKVKEYKEKTDDENSEKVKFTDDTTTSTFQNDRIKETSLMDQLMSSYITGEIDTQYMTHQILAFILAGTDTTAFGVSAGIHHLGNHPELQQELRREVNSVLVDSLSISDLDNFNLDIEEFNKFPKVRAFMKECLRVYSPVPSMIKSFTVKLTGFSLLGKLECPFFINPNLVHRDIRYWKNPEEFDISRWQEPESDTENTSKKDTSLPAHNPTLVSNENVYCYIPFSAGKRNCVGQNFATNNLMLSFIYLIKLFSFESTTEVLDCNDQVVHSALNCFVKFSLNQ